MIHASGAAAAAFRVQVDSGVFQGGIAILVPRWLGCLLLLPVARGGREEMTWKNFLLDPVFKWAFLVAVVGAVVLVAIQMWRGDALVCSDGSVFARSCLTPTIPLGAVVAFDRDNGCPAGWTEHQAAAGRFIVGVGRHSEYNVYGNDVTWKAVGDTGGTDQVRLEIDHMPSHAHQTPSTGSGSNLRVWALSATGRGEYGGRHARPTDATGGGQPHDNMPPYIAFYLCRNH